MIIGQIVNLKPFSIEDLEFLYRWNNDPEYSGKFEPLEENTREEIREWLNSSKKDESWYIIETKHHKRIGQIVGLIKNKDSIQIGFRIIPEARNKGYCTDAVSAFVTHIFKNVGLEKVTARANPQNIASRRVLEKVGFKEVGYTERAVKINGVWMDGVLYEITHETWKTLK